MWIFSQDRPIPDFYALFRFFFKNTILSLFFPLKQQNPLNFSGFFIVVVPRTRLELAHRNRNQPLKLACLPISPSGQNALRGCKYIKKFRSVNLILQFCEIIPLVLVPDLIFNIFDDAR